MEILDVMLFYLYGITHVKWAEVMESFFVNPLFDYI